MQAIEVVVGGQYGSEAKGHIAAQLVRAALKGGFHAAASVINIRVAGPNAGHTVYDDQGRKFAFRQMPVGAVLSDDVICYIAPGSEIDLPVLLDEIDQVHQAGFSPTILVSGEATLIEQRFKDRELQLVGAIGSTGKGIGATRAARLMRDAYRLKDDDVALASLATLGVGICEPRDLYADDTIAAMSIQHLIVEGTQGYGLGMHAGHYPKVTASDCTAVDFLGMAQLSPWRGTVKVFLVWVVARAYPIRVAGDSGPLENETTWEALGLPEELTTVTQKVRRVGLWDQALVTRAVQANGGGACVRLALTMADQIMPEAAGLDGTNLPDADPMVVAQLQQWALRVGVESGAPVAAITTSPTTVIWVQDGEA